MENKLRNQAKKMGKAALALEKMKNDDAPAQDDNGYNQLIDENSGEKPDMENQLDVEDDTIY